VIDLQIIEIRDLLPVKNVSIALGVEPKSVYLRGSDFRNAAEVYINEVKAPSIVVMDNTTILAQLPPQVVTAPIRSVVVVSSRLTNVGRSKINFRIGDTTRFVSGLERLIQVFLKLLLQTPGTDAFRQKLGGGIIRAAGKMSVSARVNTIVADVQLGVERTRQQIISIQAHEPQLALSEKLLYAKLLEAKFSQQEQALYCTIEIANQAMKSSVVSLEA
jgi:hypothetical protein